MSTIKKLIYIANARLPTEKAHGFQIIKMCEAFAQNGVQVILMHPFRHQPASLKAQSLFEYYNVPRLFEAQRLPNLDIVRFERFLSRNMFVLFFFIQAMLWGLYAALMARRLGADLYYTRDSAVAYWLVRLNLPTIYEAHGVPMRAHRKLLAQIAPRRTLMLVAVLTSFIKEHFVKLGFPADKVVVYPDGTDLSLFTGVPCKATCRQRLGLPEDRPIIGYVGRFRTMEMEKGIPELVQAMAHLSSLNDKEPLLLCVGGSMDAVKVYLDLARRYGVPESWLRFVDRVPNREVPLWMRACDLVTIPWGWNEFSAYYTSPMKLFEYMAAGTPIIASDLPAIREILEHRGNAWLVEPGNPGELAKGIDHLLRNPSVKDAIASEAQKTARKFTWRQRVEKILKQVAAPE